MAGQTINVSICTVDGCLRPHYAKRLCQYHWRCQRDGIRPVKRCTFTGCETVGPTYRNRCPEHQGVEDTAGRNARYRARLTPEQRREQDRRGNLMAFRITPEQYDAQDALQDGLCAVCGEGDGERRLAVDHDHACCPEKGRSCGACVRGLLCAGCNGALGLLGDDITRLERAIAYLQRGGVWQHTEPAEGKVG